MLENIVIIAVVVLIVAGALFYMYRAKKRGQKCIGCPYGKECTGSCSCKEKEENN